MSFFFFFDEWDLQLCRQEYNWLAHVRFLLWVCFIHVFSFQMCFLRRLELGKFLSSMMYEKKCTVNFIILLTIIFNRFNDYEDMLEDTWHLDYPRRPDVPDSQYPGINVGLPMWDSFPVFQAKSRKEEKVGLAEAITKSILSTGRSVAIFLSC